MWLRWPILKLPRSLPSWVTSFLNFCERSFRSLHTTASGLHGSLNRIQCRLGFAGNLSFCDQVKQLGFQTSRRVVMADFHPCREVPDFMEVSFYHVVADDLAYAERVVWQLGDDLLHRNNFDVLFNAGVLPSRKVTPIRSTRFAKAFSRNQIHLEDTRVELRDFREIHVECPNCFQGRTNGDHLRGTERRPDALEISAMVVLH